MAGENTNVKVWRRFERRNKDGSVIKFRIQHVPGDKIDEMVEYMFINYIHEENLLSTAGVGNDPLAITETKKYLSTLPEIKLSLICCLDNEVRPEDVTRNDIVAASLLYLSVKGADRGIEIPKSEPGVRLITFYLDVTKDETVYDLYKVDRYLSGGGLSVLPAYRGLGLAVELTQVRDDVCRAAGVKLNASFYTGIKSQSLARKCGYKAYYERDYAEIGELMGVKFPDHTKWFMKMAKAVD